jgi:uroporphyrinogen-III synthase
MRLLVTRPEAQAIEWVEMLRAQGVDAHALPLIAIEPQAEPAAAAAWVQLADHGLLVFVSPNAVERFFALKPAGATWPDDTRAASTGPGTTRALRDAGVPAVAIVEPPPDAEQFDSQSLWRCLGTIPWHGTRVLVLRGDGGRDWLADQLRAAGATVAFVQLYRRAVPTLSDAQRALLADALAAPAQTMWLFSSSQAVDHLRQLVPQASWAEATAWATHPRIADTARALGFGAVSTVAPTPTDVVAAWRGSIQSSAP